jgi:hypothetical protein
MPPDEPQPPLRQVNPEDLPVWLPEERAAREAFELVRDHWWAVKRYAEEHRVRGVALVDRLTAERQGGWPPPIRVVHRGAEYGVGGCPAPFGSPALQARLDQDPRRVRVVVLRSRATPGGAEPGDAVEMLFHLDRGPVGVRLAGGDRPPGQEG